MSSPEATDAQHDAEVAGLELRVAELEESGSFLRSVLENAPDFITTITVDGTVRFVNRVATGINMTRSDFVGTRIYDYITAEHHDVARACFESVVRTGKPSKYESVGLGPHGDLARYETRVGPIKSDGKVVALTLIATDITERRRAEERAAFLVEVSDVLAGSLDYTATLHTVANLLVPRLANLVIVELLDEEGGLGSSRPVVVASTEPELEQLYREMRQRYLPREPHPLLEVMRTGQPKVFNCRGDSSPGEGVAQDAEHRAMIERLWQRSTIVVPLAARGQRLGALGLAASERVFGPEDLALAQEIGRRVALAIDNARLYRHAQTAIRVRDEFLSIASHELKTPLTPVLLRVQALVRMFQGAPGAAPAPEQVLPRLESILHQLDRLHRLIEDLLDISRITVGRLRMEPEDVDLSALLAEVLRRLSDDLRRSGCRLTFKAPGSVSGQWDRVRIEQIIDNLLSNAMKYGAGRPIEVSLEADASAARLRVRDHGIGIAPADQERIFQRFERAVSERHYGGFGLGLWITRQVVQAMGGSIRVESELGEGAAFTVELPLATPA